MIARYAMDRYDKQLTDAVCAWLTANNVDPTNVPMYSTITVANGQISCEESLRVEPGRLERVYKSTPLLAPMPAELDARADWRLPPRLCDRCQTDLEETP